MSSVLCFYICLSFPSQQLASANDALVFADSIVKILMQELAEDAQLKGRMAARINSLKGDFERIAEHWLVHSAKIFIIYVTTYIC